MFQRSKQFYYHYPRTCSWMSIFAVFVLAISAIFYSYQRNATSSEFAYNFGRGHSVIVAGEETQKDQSSSYSPTYYSYNENTAPQKVEGVSFSSPQFVFQDGVFRIKSNVITSAEIEFHAIEADDIDSNSITSRTIKNRSILSKDLSRNLTIQHLAVDHEFSANSIDITNSLEVDGNAYFDQNLYVADDLHVSGIIYGSIAGSFAPSGDVNMANYIMTNIGNAGTDFTASGGLTLAGNLTAPNVIYSVSGTASRITSTVGQNPVIDISPNYVGQNSITTLGTITGGIWHGAILEDGYIASALTGKTYNALTLTANADGFSLSGGTASRTLNITGSNITLTGGGYTLTLTGNSALNQNLRTTDAPTFVTLNTGQGAYELYAMDQNVLTTSSPTFAGATLNGNLALGANTLTTSNSTEVANLNANYLEGHNAAYFQTALTNPVTGTVSNTYIPLAGASGILGNSNITSDGTTNTIGLTSAGGNLTINATLGTELITSPMVTGGWTLGYDTGGWAISGGTLSKTASTGTLTAVSGSGLTASPIYGRTYLVTITVAAVSGSPTVSLGYGSSTVLVYGTTRYYMPAGSTGNITFSGAAASTCSITSLSVKLMDNTTGKITTLNTVDAIGYNSNGLNVIRTPESNVAIGRNTLTSNTTGDYNYAIGPNVLMNNTTGISNISMGDEAMATNTTGSGNVGIGDSTLHLNVSGSDNTAVGSLALWHNTGSTNTGIGYAALNANTSANGNTCVGHQCLVANTTGNDNTSLGYQTLYSNSTGTDNTALGNQALYTNTGSNNVAIGNLSLYTNLSGGINVAIGNSALYSNSTGSYNMAIGSNALHFQTGTGATAIGANALYSNTADSSVAVGRDTLYSNTSGSGNTAVGSSSLYNNSTGYSNSSFGQASFINLSSGSNNTAIGYSAGRYYNGTTGNLTSLIQSTLIGSSVSPLASGDTNEIVIGYNAIGYGSNTATIGNTSIVKTLLQGNVGIGTTSPGTLLQVGSSSTTDGDQVTITDSDGTCTLNPESGGAWACTSDERLKKDIASLDMNGSLSKIMDLRPVSFQMKQGGDTNYGFIAQEVQSIIPEAVSSLPGGYLGVAEGKFTPYIVGAIQEQQTEISGLQLSVYDTTGILRSTQDDITKLNLSTDTNVTTLEELKSLVDKNTKLTEKQISALNDDVPVLSERISTLEDQMKQLETKTNQDLGLAQIEANKNDIDLIKLVLGLDRVENPGDVNILGKFSAQGAEILGTVKAKDIEADSIKISKSSGTGKIKAGDKETEISASEASKEVKIYVTPVGNTFDEVLYVDEIKDGDSFKVKINSSVDKDIQFNWLIIH